MTDQTTEPGTERLGLPIASKADKAFLRAQVALREETVGVPEWGCSILVREMTAEENRDYQLSNVKFDSRGSVVGMRKQDIELRLLLRTCYDGQGNRLFVDDDLLLLRKQPASVVTRLVRVARRLSNLVDDEDPHTRSEREKND